MIILLGLAIVVMNWRSSSPTATPKTSVDVSSNALAAPTMAANALSAKTTPSSAQGIIEERIANALAALAKGTPEENAATLAELRRMLDNADRRVAIAALQSVLASGKDAKTGLDFTVGPGGILAEAPTLRTFLLDELGDLSPIDALAISQGILQGKMSPDEWAVALRNVAWGDPAAQPYLAQKMGEMLAYQPWVQNPSGGFLESFDVIVYAQAVNLIPTLDQYLADPKSPLWQAASVALDRLAEYSTEQTLGMLNSSPELLSKSPGQRADFFAKAQLADATQRGEVETYLNRPDVDLAEKTKFVEQLGQPGAFVSPNLIMPTDYPPLPNTAETLQSWAQQQLGSGHYPDLKTPLEQLARPQPTP